MKKNIYYFNSLLRIYNKYRRKLDNLRKANRNERRQGILQKHIERLYEKLTLLNTSIKQKTIMAGIAVASLVFVPETANAQASFSAKQINPFSLSSVSRHSTPTFTDLDGDGDLDMLTNDYIYDYINYGESRFKYYQNTGSASNPVFASPVINPFGMSVGLFANLYLTPTFVDLDNDGDMDIVFGRSNGQFYYLQNTGTATAPIFAAPITNPFGLTDIGDYSAPTFVDMDGDGDLDLLAGEYYGSFHYFQNTGTATSPAFAARVINPFGLTSIGNYNSAPAFADMDGDGDLDMLSGRNDGNFSYYQNTGTSSAPAFAASIQNPFNLTRVGNNSNNSKPTFADLDNDGKKDVMAGDNDGNFNFYRQCTPTTSTITVNAACNYTSPNGTYYTTGGTFTNTIPNATGCDSIITINLTISPLADLIPTATNSAVCNPGATSIVLNPSQNQVKYYLRNNSDNSIVDGPIIGTGSAISLNTGTINSSTVYNIFSEASTPLSAVDLSGTDDIIRLSSPFSAYTNQITVESWINYSGGSQPWAGQSSIAVDNMATNVWLWHGGVFYVNNNGTWLALNFPAMPSGWTHVATVADATGMYIYYNGALVASNTAAITSSIRNNASSVIDLGNDPRFSPGGGRNSNVTFDDFRVWNVARTVSEILNNTNSCLSGTETGLVQYTRLNEGTGTAVNSITGSSGTIINGTANPWVLGSDVCNDACSLQLTQTVTVSVIPTPTITVNSGIICAGQSFTITPSGADTYTISGGNSVVSPTVSTTYSVTGTDLNGCVSATPATASVTITSISLFSSNPLLCVGETATLTASGATSYTWSTSENTTTITVSPTVTTSYTVTGTNSIGCVNTTTISQVTDLCTGINSLDNDVATAIFTYPNPTNGLVQITIPQELFGNTMVLTNTFGQVLETRIIDNTIIDYDLQNLATGIYFIQVKTSNGIISKKVIKN